MSDDVGAVISGARRWAVVCGDSRVLAVPPLIVGSQIHHVIADPPYDAETHDNARSLKGGGSDIPIDFAPFDVATDAPRLLTMARRWVICFSSVEMLGDYRRAWGRAYYRGGLWDRFDGTPQISGDRPGQAAEGIAIGHGPEMLRWNRGGKRGMWRHGVERVERYGHSTPKPIALMLELIGDFTDPGDIVLDPYMGDGTTGAACLRLGRRFIGFELRADYAATARDRLAAEEHHQTLREARIGQAPLF